MSLQINNGNINTELKIKVHLLLCKKNDENLQSVQVGTKQAETLTEGRVQCFLISPIQSLQRIDEHLQSPLITASSHRFIAVTWQFVGVV